MRSKMVVLLGAVSLSMAGLAGCAKTETAVAKAMISPQEEDQLGQQVQQQLDQQGTKYITDPQVVGFVTDVANKVLAKAKKDRPEVKWTIQVIDDPKTVNAFAVPGGHLYVYSGLLLAIDNEAELAGVMGHESGHVALRHSARQIVDQFGIETALGIAFGKNPSELEKIAGALVGNGTMLKFSRDDETQADEYGATAMAQAGYDPEQLPHFFEKLQSMEGKVPGIMKFLSDHPLTADRIKHMHDYIAQHGLTGSVVNPQTVPPIQAKVKSATGVAAPTNVQGPATQSKTTTTTPPAPQPQPSTQQSGAGTYHAPPPPTH